MGTDVQSFAIANLRRRPVVIETGGFVAGIDPGTDSPFVNYATPLRGARPTPADVAALVAVFRERGLRPRLEFAPDAAPGVADALRAAGFGVEAEHSYLVCAPAELTPPRTGHVAEVPDTDEDYLAVDAALSEAFGGEFPPSPAGAARLRRTQDSGGRCASSARPAAAARARPPARRPPPAPPSSPGWAPGLPGAPAASPPRSPPP
ncbi:hypothetical protein MF672_037390 [Actinomadura sp. ATCC 31491]|uniref:GNAT family N-acetyltransferase n=1 Tax=Actinomadura luzonensis TaxID=2805427 RepID=A0ABT0G495_9ACTN|nr:hypothetical protein [Actinomadura luzonensis]